MNRRLRRLLVLLPSTRLGGAERHTAELAMRLAEHGLDVTLAAEPALHEALRRPGVTLRAASLGDADRQAAETRRLVGQCWPELALLPLPWPDAAPGVLAALAEARLPRLVLLHLVPHEPIPVVVPDAGRAVFAAVSGPAAARAARGFGLPAWRVAVIDNPAPPPAAMEAALARGTLRAGLGLAPEAKLVLFVGRLEEAKGAELLPDIADRLAATLAIAGEGPLRGLLEARAASDPRGLLRVLGPVADPSPWYLAADALLLPSRLEGAPLVFLEAAAHRCPVVTTEAALEGLGGEMRKLARIAAPEPAALARAVEELLADPGGAAEVVAAAAAFAASHDWEGVVEGVLGLLRAATLRAEEWAA